MTKPLLISAICTPLTDDEDLHHDGLLSHLDQQTEAGIDGILVAGTMGLLQLLKDSTYEQLIKASVDYWHGNGEVLIGVGDAGYERTKERIGFVNRFPVDGAVALAPYFIKLTQPELVDYFTSLANVSRAPLFLYDLPQRTGTSLSFETVSQLARHPNIAGIKCSGDVVQARRLHDSLRSSGFRVVMAQPLLLDVLLSVGVEQHLDGVFALAPAWAREVVEAIESNDMPRAADGVNRIGQFLDVLVKYGVFPAAALLLNRLGVAGNSLPRPLARLSPEHREALLAEEIVQQLLEKRQPLVSEAVVRT
jgi:4-hydroxy-tetrahydrodipicolinate synthase